MLSRVLPHFIRRFAVLLLALLLGLGALGPALAQVTIFSPFNIADAMDQGVKKTADIRYREGNRGKLDIYTPEKSEGLAPVVMFIYGGAWAAGDKFEYEFVGRALAANGYVAVIADYRLFPEVRYPDFLEDCAAAAHWIEENIVNYGGDTRRFFLAGHSAGAYNAVMLGLDASFFRDQGVSMPIRAVAAISGPFNFYPFEYDQVRVIFGDAPNPEGTQPINLVAAGDPPGLSGLWYHGPHCACRKLQGARRETARPGRLGHRKILRGLRSSRADCLDGRHDALPHGRFCRTC